MYIFELNSLDLSIVQTCQVVRESRKKSWGLTYRWLDVNDNVDQYIAHVLSYNFLRFFS